MPYQPEGSLRGPTYLERFHAQNSQGAIRSHPRESGLGSSGWGISDCPLDCNLSTRAFYLKRTLPRIVPSLQSYSNVTGHAVAKRRRCAVFLPGLPLEQCCFTRETQRCYRDSSNCHQTKTPITKATHTPKAEADQDAATDPCRHTSAQLQKPSCQHLSCTT